MSAPRLPLLPQYEALASRNHDAMLAAGVDPSGMAFREMHAAVMRHNALTWDAYARIAAAFEALPEPRTFTDRSAMHQVSRVLAKYVVRPPKR